MTFNPSPSLTQQIADFLEREIILGKIKDNERIQEIKYSNQLQVSRNSVREALILLERRYLIVINPRKGAVVRPISVGDVKSLFEFIAHLYILLGQRTADAWQGEEADRLVAAVQSIEQLAKEKKREEFIELAVKFPDFLFPIVGNTYLESAIRDLQPACARVFFQFVNINESEIKDFCAFLKDVVQCIKARDKKKIETVVTRYISRVSEMVAKG